MNPQYLPETLPAKLDHVVEEAGEVLVAFGKYMRFGPLSCHPNGCLSNVKHLYLELQDLTYASLAALAALKEHYKELEDVVLG
jgi:hypothetical protein